MGGGYPKLVAAKLGHDFPRQFEFVNRGISGNRIVDVYARIKSDIINLKPDFLSILIGVNDVWHEINYKNGVDANKYEKIYEMMLGEIQAALPQTKIMIMEPFLLEAEATESNAEYPDRYRTFLNEVKLRASKAKVVAEKFGAKFLPLQDKFDAASKNSSATVFTRDGVHPTDAGHYLIAKAYLENFPF